jgi:8-oxo-dGTP pyrophosphatase MutT (NUDIX family)
MMRRSPNAVFVGGHYVFPGGAVDPADGEVVAHATRFVRHDGTRTAAVFAGADPSVPAGSLDAIDDPTGHDAYVVAAIREAFEEAGLLLARHRAGEWVDFADRTTRERFSAYRLQLNNGSCSFLDLLDREDLVVHARDLTYWSRWITPIGPPRRFDARFFVAEVPASHDATPDDGELVHAEWVRPVDALQRFEAGTFPIILPTIKTLQSMIEPLHRLGD